MKIVILVILLSLIGSGCVNGQHPIYASQMDYAMQACKDLGLVKGSPEYIKCANNKHTIMIANPTTVVKSTSRSNRGIGFLCKDSISRRDQGGMFIHCN